MNRATLVQLMALSLLGPAVASADLIINDITLDVHESTYEVDALDTATDVYNQFMTEREICSKSLSAVNKVGSVQSCSGPNTDISTMISVAVSQDQLVMWEFGSDWGRGGYIFELEFGTQTPDSPYLDDYWWGYSWDNNDVIEFTSFSVVPTDFTIRLLGFENAAAGGMSLRYSLDEGETWNIAAVNVPEPGTLALLGLGLAGLGFSRRTKA